MGLITAFRSVPIEDYVAIEQRENRKFEYYYGQLRTMPGGTIDHSTICNNVSYLLTDGVRKKDTCVAFNSEMKIELVDGKRYVYPDAGVACPRLEASKRITGAIVNPTLLVEVLSDSSIENDTGDKFEGYSLLPSLREYLIVSQYTQSVRLYRRDEDNPLLWSFAFARGTESSIELASIGITLPLVEIYRDTELVAKAEEE